MVPMEQQPGHVCFYRLLLSILFLRSLGFLILPAQQTHMSSSARSPQHQH